MNPPAIALYENGKGLYVTAHGLALCGSWTYDLTPYARTRDFHGTTEAMNFECFVLKHERPDGGDPYHAHLGGDSEEDRTHALIDTETFLRLAAWFTSRREAPNAALIRRTLDRYKQRAIEEVA